MGMRVWREATIAGPPAQGASGDLEVVIVDYINQPKLYLITAVRTLVRGYISLSIRDVPSCWAIIYYRTTNHTKSNRFAYDAIMHGVIDGKLHYCLKLLLQKYIAHIVETVLAVSTKQTTTAPYKQHNQVLSVVAAVAATLYVRILKER